MMFQLVLNNKINFYKTVEKFCDINKTFKKDVNQAIIDVKRCFTDSSALRLIKECKKVLEKPADIKVRFFQYGFIIYLLCKSTEDLFLKQEKSEQLVNAQELLRESRKKLISLMLEIYVTKLNNTENLQNNIWQKFLQKNARQLLKKRKLFGEEENIQLRFIADGKIDDLLKIYIKVGSKKIQSYFSKVFLDAIDAFVLNLSKTKSQDEKQKLIIKICCLKDQNARIFDLLYAVFMLLNGHKKNIEKQPKINNFFDQLVKKNHFIKQLASFCASHTKGYHDDKIIIVIESLSESAIESQILQLVYFGDQFCEGKITNRLATKIAYRILALIKIFSTSHISSLIEKNEFFKVLKKMQQVQQMSLMDAACFRAWQAAELMLFRKIHDQCLLAKNYSMINQLMFHMSRKLTHFRYVGLVRLWDDFIKYKEKQPIYKFRLIKEYAKYAGYSVKSIISYIYEIDLEETDPFLCLIELLAKFLPDTDGLVSAFALHLNNVIRKSLRENLIDSLLNMLKQEKKVFNSDIFRYCVLSVDKENKLFSRHFGKKPSNKDHVFAMMLQKDIELSKKVSTIAKYFSKEESDHKLCLNLLVKATSINYFNYIIFELFRKNLLKNNIWFREVQERLGLKEDRELVFYELQVKLLKLSKGFDRLVKIILLNPESSGQNFYKNHSVFPVLRDFFLIFYGQKITRKNLSSVMVAFNDDISFHWDMLFCGAPVKIMRLILEDYRKKLQEFAKKFDKVAYKYEYVGIYKYAFFIIRKYLSEELERYSIRHQIVWILQQIIRVLANNAWVLKEKNNEEIIGEIDEGIEFILKYYAVAMYFPGMSKAIKECKNITKLLRYAMFVILGSLNSDIYLEDLLSVLEKDELKFFCEFIFFFDWDEKNFLEWKKICEARISKSQCMRLSKKSSSQVITALSFLFSSYDCYYSFDQDMEYLNKVKQAGFLMYVLSKFMSLFDFGNWVTISFLQDRCYKIYLYEKNLKETHYLNTPIKKIKKKFETSPKKRCKTNYSYIKENFKFILNFSQKFFLPYYNKLDENNFDHPYMLLMHYINKCLADLLGNNKKLSKKDVVKKEQFFRYSFINQWRYEFEKHRYDYYCKSGKLKFQFRVCKTSQKSIALMSIQSLCDGISGQESNVKKICEIVGIELARAYYKNLHLLNKQLPEKLCQQLDKHQFTDQIPPECMPKYMQDCNTVENVIAYIKHIWRNSYICNPKMILAFAIAQNRNICIWQVSVNHEIEILQIDKYSNKLEFRKCKHIKEKSEVEDILYKDGEYLLLERIPLKFDESENKKVPNLTVKM